jgi:hypothetical protein
MCWIAGPSKMSLREIDSTTYGLRVATASQVGSRRAYMPRRRGSYMVNLIGGSEHLPGSV